MCALAQNVQQHFDTAGDTQFVKNAEQVVLHRMFRERQAVRDLAIGEAFSDAADNINFAGGEQGVRGSGEVCEAGLRYSFKDELQFAAVGPNLAEMHALNTLGERAERFCPAEDALCASAEGLSHGGFFRGIKKRDDAGGWRLGANLADCFKASRSIFAKLRADQRHLWLFAFYQRKNSGDRRGALNYLELTVAGQRLHQQLSAHGCAVSRQNAEQVRTGERGQINHMGTWCCG